MTGPRFKYAALGDSTAAGHGASQGGGYPERLVARLVATGEKIATMNLGRNGATSRDVLDGQLRTVEQRGPDLVTLGIGANDLWRMVPLEAFREQITAIADRLEATGAAVLVCTVPNLEHAPVMGVVESALGVPASLVRARIALMNEHIRALAARACFRVVDLFAASHQDLASNPHYFSADGFHPSDAGYERWAEIMWPEVEGVLRAWQRRQAGAP